MAIILGNHMEHSVDKALSLREQIKIQGNDLNEYK